MTESQSRRLAAILAADIAGYSALMGADEVRTVDDLKGHQVVILPKVGEFGGRIVDTAGDGILAEFASVVKAVECALAIQKAKAERNAAVDPARRMQLSEERELFISATPEADHHHQHESQSMYSTVYFAAGFSTCNLNVALSTIFPCSLNLSRLHFTLAPSNLYNTARDNFVHA